MLSQGTDDNKQDNGNRRKTSIQHGCHRYGYAEAMVDDMDMPTDMVVIGLVIECLSWVEV